MYFSPSGYYEDAEEERGGNDSDTVFSEDEAVTQRGLRRSQSTKSTRSKHRKDVRMLKIPVGLDLCSKKR